MPYTATGVQAASLEQQDLVFEDSSEDEPSFEDDTASCVPSTEDPAVDDEFCEEDVFGG